MMAKNCVLYIPNGHFEFFFCFPLKTMFFVPQIFLDAITFTASLYSNIKGSGRL